MTVPATGSAGTPRQALTDLPGVTLAGRGGPPSRASSPPRRDPAAHTQRVGDDVDEEVRKALAYVLRSTNAKPQTEAEIRVKLRRREVEGEVADEAVGHAKRLGAIDDEKLASAWVAERGLGRGFGRARLHEELSRRGLAEQLVEDALATLDERDDLAAATDLARSRLEQLPAGLSPEAVARRLAAYVTRRGHPPGLAQRVAFEVSGLGQRWD